MQLTVPLVLFSLGILMVALGAAGLVDADKIGLSERVAIIMIIIGSGLVLLAAAFYVLLLIERIKRS